MESNYKKLDVWKKSISFCKNIYLLTQDFPKNETYWLVDQMRRASVSIASNIAEWSWRNADADFLRFLHIAKWSTNEVETQIFIAYELWYISDISKNKIEWEAEEILKMLAWLIRSKSKL